MAVTLTPCPNDLEKTMITAKERSALKSIASEIDAETRQSFRSACEPILSRLGRRVMFF